MLAERIDVGSKSCHVIIQATLLPQVKQIPELRWANGVAVKEELEKQVVALIGPKDERDIPVKGKYVLSQYKSI